MDDVDRPDAEPGGGEKNDSGGRQEDKLPAYIVSEENFGIEVRYVTEIVGVQSITAVDVPACIKGVIDLKGVKIPVRDVRLQFGAKERSYNERTCIIVINMNEQPVGLIVDRVLEAGKMPGSRAGHPVKRARSRVRQQLFR